MVNLNDTCYLISDTQSDERDSGLTEENVNPLMALCILFCICMSICMLKRPV